MWRMKVQIEGRERPDDIFVDRWSTSDPAAIDVTVTHPLAPSTCFNIRSAKAVAAAKEKQKVAKHSHLIRDKRLNFSLYKFWCSWIRSTHLIDSAADFYSENAADRRECRMQLVHKITKPWPENPFDTGFGPICSRPWATSLVRE